MCSSSDTSLHLTAIVRVLIIHIYIYLFSWKPSGADKRKRKRERERAEEAQVTANKKPLTDFEVGKSYSGVVIGVRKFGAFIDIGANRDGFCKYPTY